MTLIRRYSSLFGKLDVQRVSVASWQRWRCCRYVKEPASHKLIQECSLINSLLECMIVRLDAAFVVVTYRPPKGNKLHLLTVPGRHIYLPKQLRIAVCNNGLHKYQCAV